MARTPRDRSKPSGDLHDGTALCRVRRVQNGEVRKGSYLARCGAWQRKYVVEYVVYLGVQPPAKYETSDHHVWAIGIRNLGEYYADGRVYRARSTKVTEITVRRSLLGPGGVEITADEAVNVYGGLGGYCGGLQVVEPIPVAEPLALKSCKPAWQVSAERLKAWQEKEKKSLAPLSVTLPMPPLPPEAVLESFKI